MKTKNMSCAKNEIKEKREKIVAIVSVLIPVILIGGANFWTLYTANQFGNSTEKTISKRENKRLENDKGIFNPAFRFIENKENFPTEFLISKQDYKFSNSIVKNICEDKTKSITIKLRSK